MGPGMGGDMPPPKEIITLKSCVLYPPPPSKSRSSLCIFTSTTGSRFIVFYEAAFLTETLSRVTNLVKVL